MSNDRKTFWIIASPSLLMLVLVALALAGPVSVPHNFVPGTTADATQVNANFAAVKAAVDDNHARLSDVEGSRSGVDWDNISVTGIDVRTSAVNVGTVTIDAPSRGYVVVRFDGHCFPSLGDRIILAASDTSMNWTPNDGNVDVRYTQGRFAHTRVYPVSAGPNTFYAVAENAIETAGSGFASIYGTLTATFFARQY